jgi:hypothetical protein
MEVTVATAATILPLSSSFGFEGASMGRPKCRSSMRTTRRGQRIAIECHQLGGVAGGEQIAETGEGQGRQVFLDPSQRWHWKILRCHTPLGKVLASEKALSAVCGVDLVKAVTISPF